MSLLCKHTTTRTQSEQTRVRIWLYRISNALGACCACWNILEQDNLHTKCVRVHVAAEKQLLLSNGVTNRLPFVFVIVFFRRPYWSLNGGIMIFVIYVTIVCGLNSMCNSCLHGLFSDRCWTDHILMYICHNKVPFGRFIRLNPILCGYKHPNDENIYSKIGNNRSCNIYIIPIRSTFLLIASTLSLALWLWTHPTFMP